MFEKAIQKLRKEWSKLTRNAKEFDTKYKSEIQRIDTAIEDFDKGVVVLGSKDSLPRRSAAQEIENILDEHGAVHVCAVTEELHPRGQSMALQSVLCLSNVREEKEKVQTRIPATFALLPKSKRTARTNVAA